MFNTTNKIGLFSLTYLMHATGGTFSNNRASLQFTAATLTTSTMLLARDARNHSNGLCKVKAQRQKWCRNVTFVMSKFSVSFQYELCAVPPSLIDEYGCLRKGKKSVLCNRLGVVQIDPSTPDVVIVDMQQNAASHHLATWRGRPHVV